MEPEGAQRAALDHYEKVFSDMAKACSADAEHFYRAVAISRSCAQREGRLEASVAKVSTTVFGCLMFAMAYISRDSSLQAYWVVMLVGFAALYLIICLPPRRDTAQEQSDALAAEADALLVLSQSASFAADGVHQARLYRLDISAWAAPAFQRLATERNRIGILRCRTLQRFPIMKVDVR